jgi:hypothetical protein
MKRIIYVIWIFTLISCNDNPEAFIQFVDGYWEIEKVILPDGTQRDYSYNESIDYFSISDSLSGFRKKLKPNFEGNFTASKNAESMKLVIENDSLNIYYTTPFDNWKETILYADSEKLKIINSNKNVYLYKRYTPLEIE